MPLFAAEREYDAEVTAATRHYPAVPPSLVKAIIGAESRFNPDAVRGEPHLDDASRGLMQVLYRTAVELGFKGPADLLFIPATSVGLGTQLLNQLYRATGNWPDAISAYNGGIRPHLGFGRKATAPVRVCLARNSTTGVCERWRDVPAGEYANQDYVDKVLRYQRYFETGTLPPATRAAGAGVLLAALGLGWLLQGGA